MFCKHGQSVLKSAGSPYVQYRDLYIHKKHNWQSAPLSQQVYVCCQKILILASLELVPYFKSQYPVRSNIMCARKCHGTFHALFIKFAVYWLDQTRHLYPSINGVLPTVKDNRANATTEEGLY